MLKFLVISLVIFFLFVFLSPSNELVEFIKQYAYGEEICHSVAYCYLMFQCSLMFPGEGNRIKIFLLLVMMGIGIEFLQEIFPNRGFEFGDVLANISGLLLGLFFSVLVDLFLAKKNKSAQSIPS